MLYTVSVIGLLSRVMLVRQASTIVSLNVAEVSVIVPSGEDALRT